MKTTNKQKKTIKTTATTMNGSLKICCYNFPWKICVRQDKMKEKSLYICGGTSLNNR